MTLFDWLYARVGILLLCGKYFHKHNISPSGKVWAHKTRLTMQCFLKCLYQARKMSSDVFVC